MGNCCKEVLMGINEQGERLTHHRERPFCCQTIQVAARIGSTNPASSLNPTRFSSRVTGHACIDSGSCGRIRGNNLSARCSCGDSQVAHWSGSRITGIRSWIGSMSLFASVVMMQQLSMVSPSFGCHVSQSPAKAIGTPDLSLIYHGCLTPFSVSHSSKPEAG